MFNRLLLPRIEKVRNKVIVLYGARQVGKTTLAKIYLQKYQNIIGYSCDDLDVVGWLGSNRLSIIQPYIQGFEVVLIDEAQRVKNIGLSLKLMYENFPDTILLVTGSSSFDLANQVLEPLTGRSREFILPPLLLREAFADYGFADFQKYLKTILKYGLYPSVAQNYLEDSVYEAEDELKNIAKNYLYKDILNFDTVKNPQNIQKMLVYLASSVGSEINLHKMSNALNLDQKTIQRYLLILEQSFIVFRLNVYSKRKKGEIINNFKVYFWDVGIRNTVLQDYRDFDYRDDLGKLFENLVIAEFYKNKVVFEHGYNLYFWRTYTNLEVDLIKENNIGEIEALEIKITPEKLKKSIVEEFGSYKMFSVQQLWEEFVR